MSLFFRTKRRVVLFCSLLVGVPSWVAVVLVNAQAAPATSGWILVFLGVLCLFTGCIGGILFWNFYAKDRVERLLKFQSDNREDQPPPLGGPLGGGGNGSGSNCPWRN